MNSDQLCFVSKNLVEGGYQIYWFFHFSIADDSSAWFFLSADDSDDVTDTPSNFYTEPISNLILHCPLIRPYLSKPVGSQFVFDPENRRILDYTKRRTFTSAGKMSFPYACGIRPQLWKWLRFDPIAGLFGFLALCCSIGIFVHHPAWLVGVAFFGLRPTVSWLTFYECFKWGELIPGLVVSVKPTLVASEFVVRANDEQIRQLEIKRFRIRRGAKRKLRIGDQVPLAGIPKKKMSWPLRTRWSYDLVPVYFATSNPRILAATQRRITSQEWESLKEAITQLKPPIRVGRISIAFPSDNTLEAIEKTNSEL
jgi:hypothetical protein